MRRIVALSVVSALLVACSDGPSSPTAVNPPAPSATAQVGGAWSGTTTVTGVTYSSDWWGYGDDSTCLKEIPTIRAGTSAVLRASLSQDGTQVEGTLTLASGTIVQLQGTIHGPQLSFDFVEPLPEVEVACADGSRHRLRLASGGGRAQVDASSAALLNGSQNLTYAVVRPNDPSTSGRLDLNLTLTLAR